MKKLYLLLTLFAPAISFAQWTTSGVNVFHNTAGLVGIGTSTATTFTNAKLNVYKSGNGTSVLIGNPSIASGSYTSLRLGTSADLNGYSFINSIKGAAATPVYGDLVLNQAGGNVGIGTATPSAKLNVYQAGASTKLILGNSSTGSGGFTSLILGTSADKNGYTFLSSIKSSGTAMGDLVLSPDGGNVGIGKSPGSNYKLDVAGTINATSILLGAAGNVGIGTTTPLNGLNVFNMGDFNSGSIRFGHSGTNDGVISLGYNSTTGRDALKLSYFPHNSTTGQTDLMTLDINGSVGIGTTTPLNGLNVFNLGNFNSGSIRFGHSGAYDGVLSLGYNSTTGRDALKLSYFPHNSTTGQTDLMTLDINGSVGIGTTTPGSYKLAVEGKIGAREVNVTTAAWSDYVFNKEFNLLPLEKLQEFIDENHHLPDVPSEQEVLKNGQDLGAMNAVLLKKIEELTLYMIEMKKENEAIKKEVNNLKERKSKQ